MAIIMRNSANITYNYTGETNAAVSNMTTTSIAEEHSMTAEKLSQNSAWRPSENLTYILRVENTGTQPIYAISIQDDLGGAEPLLSFVAGSAKMIMGSVVTPIVPTSTSPLTIAMPGTLEAGEGVLFSYIAKVKSSIDPTIDTITNSVTVAGHEASAAGPVITVTPAPSLSLPKAEYAEVRIEKRVDKDTASIGDKLTYVFRLENYGNAEATNVTLRDDLPENFTVESIQSETGGSVTVYEAADYSVDTDNKLILPTSTTKLISVPAATAAGSGVTTITIVGTITG